MNEHPLTSMAVHAHPDDEASTTGGILAKYSAQAIRVVLIFFLRFSLSDFADQRGWVVLLGHIRATRSGCSFVE